MFTRRLTAKDSLAPVIGTRANSALENNARTFMVALTFTGQLDVTVAGTLRNRGSILAAYTRAGLDVDGTDRIAGDPRSLRAYFEVASRRNLPATRAAGAGVQAATQLSETLILPASIPGTMFPGETALLEENVQQAFRAFVERNSGDVAAIIGGGTGTLTNMAVRVNQYHDPHRDDKPIFRVHTREVVHFVTSSGFQEISIRGGKYVAGLVIQQDSDAGEVSDIIDTVQIIGDDNRAIVPQPVAFSDLQAVTATVDDAAVLQGGAYAVVNFTDEGMLSKVVHPGAFVNFRLRVDAQPSVTAGATNSKIRVTLIELDQHATLTKPLPFAI